MSQDYDSPLGGFPPSSPDYRPLRPPDGTSQGTYAGPTQPSAANQPGYGPPGRGAYGPYGPPPEPGYPIVPGLAQPRQKSFTPVLIEILLAIFGIYGVGWLMIGETTTGLLLLLGGLAWSTFVVGGSVATAFTGACCLVPLHVLFIALSATLLSNRIKAMP